MLDYRSSLHCYKLVFLHHAVQHSVLCVEAMDLGTRRRNCPRVIHVVEARSEGEVPGAIVSAGLNPSTSQLSTAAEHVVVSKKPSLSSLHLSSVASDEPDTEPEVFPSPKSEPSPSRMQFDMAIEEQRQQERLWTRVSRAVTLFLNKTSKLDVFHCILTFTSLLCFSLSLFANQWRYIDVDRASLVKTHFNGIQDLWNSTITFSRSQYIYKECLVDVPEEIFSFNNFTHSKCHHILSEFQTYPTNKNAQKIASKLYFSLPFTLLLHYLLLFRYHKSATCFGSFCHNSSRLGCSISNCGGVLRQDAFRIFDSLFCNKID